MQQALALSKALAKPLVPMASKRASVAQPRPPSHQGEDDLSSSEEEGRPSSEGQGLPEIVTILFVF